MKKMIGLMVIALAFALATTACDDGSGGGGGGAPPVGWGTWVDATSTAKVNMTPTADKQGCDVTVTGTANTPDWNNWKADVRYNYTATVGKTYKVSWKWKADDTPFQNVTIQYIQQKDYQNGEAYQFGTGTNMLTIPTTEETKEYTFTMLANCLTHFTFMIGADTGTFAISNFKVEDITPVPGTSGTFTLTGIPAEYNGKYAILFAGDDDGIIGAQTVNISTRNATLPAISNKSVSIPLWKPNANYTSVARYSGNDTFVVFIFIKDDGSFNGEFDQDDFVDGVSFESVAFSNGSASKTWSQGVGGNGDEITIGAWTWSAWGDQNDNGTSTAAISESSGAITLSGTLNNGYQYPYAGCSAEPDATELAKLRTAQSISFKVKGDGKTYKVVLPTSNITDYSYYYYRFTASATETTITVNLSTSGANSLSKPNWGQGNFDKTKIEGINWQTDDNSTAGSFSLTIRDLTLNQN
jgi:hypothetical protein